jgi:hypothetical protein
VCTLCRLAGPRPACVAFGSRYRQGHEFTDSLPRQHKNAWVAPVSVAPVSVGTRLRGGGTRLRHPSPAPVSVHPSPSRTRLRLSPGLPCTRLRQPITAAARRRPRCAGRLEMPHARVLARAHEAQVSVWWTRCDGAVHVGLGERLRVWGSGPPRIRVSAAANSEQAARARWHPSPDL